VCTCLDRITGKPASGTSQAQVRGNLNKAIFVEIFKKPKGYQPTYVGSCIPSGVREGIYYKIEGPGIKDKESRIEDGPYFGFYVKGSEYLH
jgi:hypothetical protein